MRINTKLSLTIAPFILIISYLLLTVLCFFYGPINWPIDNGFLLNLFLMVTFLAITSGYLFGMTGSYSASTSILSTQWVTYGCLLALFLFPPMLYVYTHKAPWQIWEVISNQGNAYQNMLNVLSTESVGRKIVSLVHMIVAPLTIAAIPLAILCWSHLDFRRKILVITFILSQLIFSLMRGTDKEIADLLILAMSSGLICLGRSYIKTGRFLSKRKKGLLIVISLCVLVFAFSLFTERKTARVGNINYCMLHNPNFCLSYDGPILSTLSDSNKFGLAMLSTYLSHGYYGLYLALNKPFDTMFGLGHSYILTSLYTKVTGDDNFYSRSYLSKIKDEGWDDMGVWSTIFPWIANDISFIGVPFFIGFIAFILAKAWRSAVYGFDNAAAIVFTVLLLFFIYAPANNQLTQTIDMYYCFLFWMVIWAVKALLSNGRLYVRE